MFGKYIKRQPSLWLLGFAILGFVMSVILFYPGLSTPDTLSQLCQAKHECQLDTWHPIAMALVWSGLLYLMAGNESGMLLLQLVFLWAALYVFSRIIFTRTDSVAKAATVFVVGVLPNILAVSGVVWKDTQMAGALLLATALVCMLRTIPSLATWVIWLSRVAAPLLLFYAVALRVNGLAAALPIVWLYLITLWPRIYKPKLVAPVLSLVCIGLALLLVSVVNNVAQAHKSSSTVTMYVLDIVNILDKDELRHTAPRDIQTHLLKASGCSLYDNAHTELALWLPCSDGYDSTTAFYSESTRASLSRYWRQTVLQHPTRYIAQKIETYTQFMFPGDEQLVWISFPVGSVIDRARESVSYSYVMKFGYEYFGFMYKAWFWTIVSVAGLAYVLQRQRGALTSSIAVLLVSSLANIVSYAPGSITPDLRFIYWSMLATSVAGILMAVEYYSDGRKFNRHGR